MIAGISLFMQKWSSEESHGFSCKLDTIYFDLRIPPMASHDPLPITELWHKHYPTLKAYLYGVRS